MAEVLEQLQNIETMLNNLRYVGAEQQLGRLIQTLDSRDLEAWVPELRRTIERFLPARRSKLNDLMSQRLKAPVIPPKELEPIKPAPDNISEVIGLQQEIRQQLAELSEHHIFQWSTSYRDAVGQIFARVEVVMRAARNPAEVRHIVSDEFSRHAREIWSKGFLYLTSSAGVPVVDAISKSLSGMQRFIELPVEPYSFEAGTVKNASDARAVKATCSSIVSGILEGYGAVDFGPVRGWDLLAQHSRIGVTASHF